MTQPNDGDNWGPWIDWAGGECPIPDAKAGEWHLQAANGGTFTNLSQAEIYTWRHIRDGSDIIAYRVRQPDMLARAIEALRPFGKEPQNYDFWGTGLKIKHIHAARAIIAEYDKRRK